jgi:hypothetical protein
MDWIDADSNFNFFQVDLADGFDVVRSQIESTLLGNGDEIDFSQYRDDPIRFGEEVFGETYTDDVKKLMLSVRDNRDTLAKSANATGKSHAAARIALWFFLCFPESQVYTAAAPPEDNLRKVLWSEIGSIRREAPARLQGTQS